MKRLSFLTAAVFFAIAAFVVFNNISASENVSARESLAVGSTVENFKLADTSGAEKSLRVYI